MKTTIAVTEGWDMGHRLPNHGGLCRNLHGHRYTVELRLSGEPWQVQGAPDEGMVADFTNVKRTLRATVRDLYDHRMLLSEGDPLAAELRQLPGVRLVPFVPTAENIAAELCEALRARGVQALTSLRLWETPTSWAEVLP